MLKNIKNIITIFAVIAIVSCSVVNGYMQYAAVYYNEKTDTLVRLGGDFHGLHLPGGDIYDKQSYENIKNA